MSKKIIYLIHQNKNLTMIRRRNMYLFERENTRENFERRIIQIKGEIEKLSNEVICLTEIDELVKYYVNKYQIEKIEIFKDNITKDISEVTVKEYNPFYQSTNSQFEPKYYSSAGIRVTFDIPFDGEEILLSLRPSTFLLRKYLVDQVKNPTESEYGKIILSLEFKATALKEIENVNEFITSEFNKMITDYYSLIIGINQEVEQYNERIVNIIRENLKNRFQKAKDYLQLREQLDLPLKLNPDAPNSKPILLKKQKKKISFPTKSKPEYDYEISDMDYENINNIISLACISMEKSSRTYIKLMEEELRDIILSNLNTHYQGTATGETFNKTGKTDIYIPFESKAAYIAECKIWHGNKKFLEAIDQLCGYTTWRDTKTSLIIFNKENKDFTTLLSSINETLSTFERCKNINRLKQNEWQGFFRKENESTDLIKINIVVYDLYIK